MDTAQLAEWLLEQVPTVVVLVIVGVALWRQNQQLQDDMAELLEACWRTLLARLEDGK